MFLHNHLIIAPSLPVIHVTDPYNMHIMSLTTWSNFANNEAMYVRSEPRSAADKGFGCYLKISVVDLSLLLSLTRPKGPCSDRNPARHSR
jgi:hypothetical protein